MLIGILQTGHMADELRSDMGDYADLFERLLAGQDFSFRTWNVVDMDFPDGPADADGWLITGSKHGVYEDHPFIPPLEALIRDIRDAGRPLIGVCFGHQIIAQALGGTVEKFARGWSVGRRSYDWQGEEIALNAWHQDQVTRPPEDARILASNAFCDNAAMLIGDSVFTVQAHPEFSDDVVAGLAKHRGPGVVPDDLLFAATESLGHGNDNDRLAAMMGLFFRERRLA